MWTTEAAVQAVVLSVVPFVLVAVFDLMDVPWWAWLLWALVLVSYVAVVPTWRYRVHRWEVTDTAVYTQTGWWARERRIAPMSRIQTVDHVEGAISRLFGLATVTVTTASAAGALAITGLDRLVARGLVDELTVKADAVEGDAT
jgi:membrane protein YdbS with pleckstrin-like domain